MLIDKLLKSRWKMRFSGWAAGSKMVRGRGHSLATLLPPSRVAARPPPLVAGSLPGLQRRSNLDRWSTGGGSAHRAHHRAEAPHQDHHGLVGRRPSWPRDVPGERQDESALKTSSDSSLRPVGHKVKLAVGGNTTLFHSSTLLDFLQPDSTPLEYTWPPIWGSVSQSRKER